MYFLAKFTLCGVRRLKAFKAEQRKGACRTARAFSIRENMKKVRVCKFMPDGFSSALQDDYIRRMCNLYEFKMILRLTFNKQKFKLTLIAAKTRVQRFRRPYSVSRGRSYAATVTAAFAAGI